MPHNNHEATMRKWIIALSCVFVCALAQQASAAVKYKRFLHCGEGYVTQKTCECHAVIRAAIVSATPDIIATRTRASADNNFRAVANFLRVRGMR
jgi:hypothetical protein